MAAGILLVLLGLSYVPPSAVPFMPSLTLGTPVLLVVNSLFFLYWLLGLSKKCLLSFLILLICSPFLSSFVQFNLTDGEQGVNKKMLKLLSFNSHYFNSYVTGKSFKNSFLKIIKEEQPDIMFLQEANLEVFDKEFEAYKYREATVTNGRAIGANPILSKYPIINHGSVGMDNVHIGRNALFVDVIIDNDTLRCYNAHLTSYRLAKEAEELQEKGAKTIVSQLNKVFIHQENQINIIANHIKTSKYPVIFCGDFNNMAFSYVYKEVKKAGNLKDTFVEKGSGFGATHDFNYFPTRIDFVLVPNEYEVLSHKVLKTKKWSDHYPVISAIAL